MKLWLIDDGYSDQWYVARAETEAAVRALCRCHAKSTVTELVADGPAEVIETIHIPSNQDL